MQYTPHVVLTVSITLMVIGYMWEKANFKDELP